MRNTTVLISGASVAGPALAYWLDRYGFDVTVVEKAPALRGGGQAIDFTGHTHMAVLERMGIIEDIKARQTGKTDMVLVDAQGRQQALISGEFTGGDIEILRGDLSEVMYERTADNCRYLFGDTITALTETTAGVDVEFARAPARTFDLVFGCDGIHSRVRKLTFGPEQDFVKHQGYYYCIAGASHWELDGSRLRERAVSHGHNAPGRLALVGGSKAGQMYLFASPQLDYDRDDFNAQRRLIAEKFAGVGWEVPGMLAELPGLDGFYLDSISKVSMKTFVKGRVALLGDSGYGSTLAGFGTGLAVVGAYVLAGELATAGGDYAVAFSRYQEMMKRYCKMANGAQPGRFLAPKTALGLRLRNWFLQSRFFDMMVKSAENSKNDIELKNYPEIVGTH
ncbi:MULTISPECIES: FAD-dependent monooxygenase [Rhodococcus]|jgi:2-polyprenyl-6-methoxyphenol hydroxylase-like FAD-dependent oxidoreductase|uniref:FAD-dependent monooxygenase n=1 Tax=Rhodococcus TaxID=1827 RepID=UPI000BCEA29A|nr:MULTISPECIES: FAD-dependent monooxygenase [Rhodococcus]MBP1162052.1 2-polyprenyl-6-methoxyphenol hydroxylase-like FAD-dependent oxidoreductase [Rhodococcus sp. PvR099]MCZ4557807.1 FAD-dependent monooxygenase [Rhodococcus maanshanensis]PTR43238.1 2-polyprenyl-6-methoxyphenol hydroxylase-like FAD-dependent oxidoreductase [Rhodococcus sp. OK611]SNX91101.1 2-polyprenyl-6-methoxyphenol hydroxylase [Rhodococcus sp. OK270]